MSVTDFAREFAHAHAPTPRPSAWLAIWEQVLENELSRTDHQTGRVLRELVERSDADGFAELGLAELAQASGVVKPTLVLHLRALGDLGLVESYVRLGTCCRYRLAFERLPMRRADAPVATVSPGAPVERPRPTYVEDLRAFLERTLPADGQPVQWREVMREAEKVAPRSVVRAELYDLLHATISVQWGGPKGQRWVARRPDPSAVEAVECPACGAESGQPCHARNAANRLTVHPHDARRELAALRRTVA